MAQSVSAGNLNSILSKECWGCDLHNRSIDFTIENGFCEINIYLTSLCNVFCKNTICLRRGQISSSSGLIGLYTVLIDSSISKECAFEPNPKYVVILKSVIQKILNLRIVRTADFCGVIDQRTVLINCTFLEKYGGCYFQCYPLNVFLVLKTCSAKRICIVVIHLTSSAVVQLASVCNFKIFLPKNMLRLRVTRISIFIYKACSADILFILEI